MLKQQLQQKLQQKLSPSQIQTVKLVEITTLELEDRIRQELEENPALEDGFDEPSDTGDSLDADDSENFENELDTDTEEDILPDTDFDITYDYDGDKDSLDDEIPEYRLKTSNVSPDDKQNEIPFSDSTTFHEYLVEQIAYLSLTDHEKKIAFYVIGNIDEEGYLRRMPDVIVDDLLFQSDIDTTTYEIEKVIELVQTLEPAGVGALNLQQCLLLQLMRKRQTPQVTCAEQILTGYFEAFTKKHYEKIKRGLAIEDEMLKNAIAEIVKLNPKPGNAISGDMLEKTKTTIIPDFLIENNNGQLVVHLNNSNIPELHINREYNEMLKDYTAKKSNQTKEMKDALMFVKQKVESAQWFIDAVKQRQQTLLVTMNAIVSFQREYFLEGHESYLKPMILKDIADITGYDVSTISRVSNSKYVETEFGIFSIKYFFSESITNDLGEEVSTREIKKIMMECVEKENKKKPMNDDALADILKEKGYTIARRTVAKYREQLNIPVARLRVEI